MNGIMSNKVIAIRADANKKIASGHIMRCLSIAVRLRKLGCRVLFIVSDEFGLELIKAWNFESICLNNDYEKKNSEINVLADIIKKYDIDLLLVDSYEVDYKYMSSLGKLVKLVYIDDMRLERYPVDKLINYTIGVSEEEYLEMGYAREQLLIGNEYVPLREEFSKQAIVIKEAVENIFITTGGADEYDMVFALVEGLKKSSLSTVKKHIVVGRFYEKYDKLLEKAKREENLVIYRNISNICDIMRMCDIAISAGGTTLAEVCACGIPTVCFSVADNQLFGTKAYASEGIIEYAGDVRDGKNEIVNEILGRLEALTKDFDKRRRVSNDMKSVIDGYGAERIARELVDL